MPSLRSRIKIIMSCRRQERRKQVQKYQEGEEEKKKPKRCWLKTGHRTYNLAKQKSIFKIRSCPVYPSRQLLSKRFLWHYVIFSQVALPNSQTNAISFSPPPSTHYPPPLVSPFAGVFFLCAFCFFSKYEKPFYGYCVACIPCIQPWCM